MQLWKTVWKFLKNLKIELPYDSSILFLGIGKKIIIQKHTCTPIFIVALFTIASSWKKPKCPSTDEWMKKMLYIYTMEYYSAIIKNNEIMPFAAIWIWLQIIILSEVSQKEKHEYHMILLICKIWSMMQMNLPMKQKYLQR